LFLFQQLWYAALMGRWHGIVVDPRNWKLQSKYVRSVALYSRVPEPGAAQNNCASACFGQ
jgi:hypothetical protein